MKSGTTSVGNSATAISASNTSRKKVIVTNEGTVTMYLGGSGVTTSDGLPLLSGDSFQTSDYVGTVFGVVAGTTSASGTAAYLEME